ncbi:MAG: sugar phosphate isomerase/epimerase [Alistipes sp.]|jgi:sugar phosphate isomerase/epimerase|nr:sugar phosphate isomerase/epimerase [Alistipes sp.]
MGNNKLTRRGFLGTSAAALGAVALATPLAKAMASTPTAPQTPAIGDFGTKFGGVQIGAITYSWRDMPAGLENIIKYCKETGINSLELMSGDLEMFLGAPESPARNFPRPPRGERRPPLTAEQQAAMDKYNADLRAFRLGVNPARVAAARKLFDDAGIGVHIVKFAPSRWSDEEIDYAFATAKAMGAKAVCEEVSESAVSKLAPFATKHGMYCVFHNHNQFAEPGFSVDPFLAVAPSVMLNFDMGHYYGSTGLNPSDFVRKYHDRIFSIHIKDKTGPKTDPANTNQVWGQGETPLAELLLLIKREGWPIYLDIELEYAIAPWSNSVKEVRTSAQYARNILI